MQLHKCTDDAETRHRDDFSAFTHQFTTAFNNKDVVKLGRKYYLVRPETHAISQRIKEHPFFMGTYLGESKKTFQPSPAILDLLAMTSKKKAVVDKKAAWLYLCGRDVFEKSILSMDSSLKESPGSLVIVQDEEGETLGYGKIVTAKRGMMIKNFLDKGAYLRMER